MAYKEDSNFGFRQSELRICVNQTLSPGNAIVKITEARNVDFFSAWILSKDFISRFLCFLFLLTTSSFFFSKVIIIPSKKFIKRDGKF
jgi:hypothetical protein